MAKVLNMQLDELDSTLIQALKAEFGEDAAVELRLRNTRPDEALLSETNFWRVIDSIDWSQASPEGQLRPAIAMLAAMPLASIYLFSDILSEKLFLLDTRAHGDACLQEGELSVDDFLYVRCGIVAEGRDYYEKILQNPSEMPHDLSFEPLLNLADRAYQLKTGKKFEYFPANSVETYSNAAGWQS